MSNELSDYRKRERSELTTEELIIWINTVMGDLDARELRRLATMAEMLRGERTVRE